MLFRVKYCVILLATLCSLKQCECDGAGDSDSDDDQTIKEALLLIRLIRTGSAPNRSLVAEVFSSFPAISLRPPSMPKAPMNVSSNTIPPAKNAWRRKMQGSKKIDSRRRGQVKRRPVFYRRQDYDDIFGAHPNQTSVCDANGEAPTTFFVKLDEFIQLYFIQSTMAPPSTVTISSTLSSTIAPSAASASASVAPSVSNPAETVTAPTASTSQDLVKGYDEKKTSIVTALGNDIHRTTKLLIQKLSLVKRNSSTSKPNREKDDTESGAKDPIVSQVQTELENELKGVTSISKKGCKSQGHDAHGNLIQTKIPSTLRIHLRTSTRYPIPLPENHALCYHHPDNGLCRTPI